MNVVVNHSKHFCLRFCHVQLIKQVDMKKPQLIRQYFHGIDEQAGFLNKV